MRALTVLVRNLATLELAGCQQPAPALEAFLARCKVETDSHQSITGWMCASFGVRRQHDWPVASILAQAMRPENGSKYWICAQPVHLAVDRDDLVLQPVSQLQLTTAESRELFSAIATHFAEEQLEMEHVATGLWCIGATRTQELSTTDIGLVEGRSIDGLLPGGADAARWQRLVTEAQMTLHEHPQNLAREQKGKAPVNSLWIWGGGVGAEAHKHFDSMCVLDPLLHACAALTDTPLIEAPRHANNMIVDGHALFEFVVQANDTAGASLSELEADWLSPAWQALKSGQLDQLSLVLALPRGVLICQCDRKARRKFWKKRQPLQRFLARWQSNQ